MEGLPLTEDLPYSKKRKASNASGPYTRKRQLQLWCRERRVNHESPPNQQQQPENQQHIEQQPENQQHIEQQPENQQHNEQQQQFEQGKIARKRLYYEAFKQRLSHRIQFCYQQHVDTPYVYNKKKIKIISLSPSNLSQLTDQTVTQEEVLLPKSSTPSTCVQQAKSPNNVFLSSSNVSPQLSAQTVTQEEVLLPTSNSHTGGSFVTNIKYTITCVQQAKSPNNVFLSSSNVSPQLTDQTVTQEEVLLPTSSTPSTCVKQAKYPNNVCLSSNVSPQLTDLTVTQEEVLLPTSSTPSTCVQQAKYPNNVFSSSSNVSPQLTDQTVTQEEVLLPTSSIQSTIKQQEKSPDNIFLSSSTKN
ncbi:unnamed protein product [Mytilus coruscus]|uniref:Uncharacterized protein n=1 Tax=Mytilus coruscus TaxID=42192 RepID=A0A6J8ESZ3_MYTCO|nr:unnamed protein product [Mytilus coruscus]